MWPHDNCTQVVKSVQLMPSLAVLKGNKSHKHIIVMSSGLCQL